MAMKIKIFALLTMLMVAFGLDAQVTSSSLAGKVTLSDNNEAVIGATVIATHVPSGTRYTAVTNQSGNYAIQGMRVGGPYTVTISYIGYETKTLDKIYLTLGETYDADANLSLNSQQLQEVVVTGKSGIDATKTGAAMAFTAADIARVPSIDHSVADATRLNPFVNISQSGAMTFNGVSNRYNSFMVDGAVNNDVFGLTSNGQNGGQAGTQPISMETVDQIQVQVAPFDVRQSGFTGGSINAITKSGTNMFHGSVYGDWRNQDLIGEKYKLMNGKTSEKYQHEKTYHYGVTLGGPIIKDKLFFFANYEKANDEYNNPYKLGSSTSRVNGEVAQQLLSALQAKGYTGTFNNPDNYTKSDKGGFKLDWNINDKNKLTLGWRIVSAKQLNSNSTAGSLNATDYQYDFKSVTNSFTAELHSNINQNWANEALLSYVRVRDSRNPHGVFPMIQISGVGNGNVVFGTERSSCANGLNQDVWSFTDNVNYYRGNHTFTFGTHEEFYKFKNLFIQDNYGTYYFASPDDFYAALNGETGHVKQYRYGQANTDVTGDPRWWASFSAGQMGFYAQDQWRASRDLTLTYGLRADAPIFLNKPTENPTFNATKFATDNNEYVGVVPKANILWAPRFGFRMYLDDAHKALLRGGVGLFTGQAPFVWLSNAYNNTGMEAKSISVNNPAALNADSTPKYPGFKFTSTPYDDLVKTGVFKAGSSGATINTMNENFKYPQTFRVNLGYDQNLGNGFKFTFDGLFSKTMNNVMFTNLAISSNAKVYAVNPAVAASNPESAAAPYYTIDSGDYYAIVALTNTSAGYTYSLSGKLEKHFDWGLDLMGAYTFGHSYSVNDGTSSVAYSNWKYNYSVDTNSGKELSFSRFDRPHRIIAMASYTSPKYAGFMSTNVTLTYEGQSGQRYCYTYSEDADFNGDGQKGNSLMYIPTVEEIGYMTWSSAEDAQKFENFIRSDSYLSSHRGMYSERNAGIAPFEHHFDLHVSQNFFYDKKHNRKVELMLDVKNISNLFNRAWGLYYGSAYYLIPLKVTDVTKVGDGYVPSYKWYGQTAVTLSDFYSRWRCQLGLRLTF